MTNYERELLLYVANYQRYLSGKLDRVLSLLTTIQQSEETMAADLTQITADVQANTDATGSIVTLVQGLAAKIEELKNDPAALSALAGQLEKNTASIVAAVAANTDLVPPPAPPAPPTPAPTPDQNPPTP